METKYNKHWFIICQNVGLSLLSHDVGILLTVKHTDKQCTQCLIPLLKYISYVNV